jgi:UDP-N-acetylmuramoyl-L-alanyl-D-glutamate--2,6-diaminopimelate ligase
MELGKLAGAGFGLDERAARLSVKAITANSSEVTPGALFAALAGSRSDGADFVSDAVARGAVAVLTRQDVKLPGVAVPVLRAGNPRLALSQMAARFYPRQPAVIAAVTGTAGKTSVASFLRQIWEHEGNLSASIGTTGIVAPNMNRYGNLTTPDPVVLHKLLDQLAAGGVTHAAMEASSHGLDQFRLDGVRLAAGAFTNLGRDHMDYHPDIAHYFNAKMRLFRELLPAGAPAIINADDARSAEVAEIGRKSGLDLRTVGRKGTFLALKRIEHERFRQVGELQAGERIYRIELPLAGDFQFSNALVAAGLAIATGSDEEAVIGALSRLKGAPGRLELIGHARSGAPVYVDYAHKPEALEQVLSSLRPFVTGRLFVVFGCGGDRDPGKRPIMGEIAVRLADHAIVTDDNPRSEEPSAIRSEILAGATGAEEIGDRKQAIETAIARLDEGDVLVVAGKGHEEGQIVGDTVLPFSDAGVVRDALRQYAGRVEIGA